MLLSRTCVRVHTTHFHIWLIRSSTELFSKGRSAAGRGLKFDSIPACLHAPYLLSSFSMELDLLSGSERP